METSTKIISTKQCPNPDDDFDTHVFMLHGDDDDVIMKDQDHTMMDPYWSKASSPDSIYNENLQPFYDLHEYFSSGPFSSSTATLEDEDVKWRIEYDRSVKKHRTLHPS